jgi:hypothetical protein
MTFQIRLLGAALLVATFATASPIILAPAHAQPRWEQDQPRRWVPPEDRRRNDTEWRRYDRHYDRHYDRRDDGRYYDRHSDRHRRYYDDRSRYSRRDRDRDRDRNDPVEFLQQLLR